MSAVSHDPETCPSAPRDRDKLSFFGPPAQSGLCHTQMYKGLRMKKLQMLVVVVKVVILVKDFLRDPGLIILQHIKP